MSGLPPTRLVDAIFIKEIIIAPRAFDAATPAPMADTEDMPHRHRDCHQCDVHVADCHRRKYYAWHLLAYRRAGCSYRAFAAAFHDDSRRVLILRYVMAGEVLVEKSSFAALISSAIIEQAVAIR